MPLFEETVTLTHSNVFKSYLHRLQVYHEHVSAVDRLSDMIVFALGQRDTAVIAGSSTLSATSLVTGVVAKYYYLSMISS